MKKFVGLAVAAAGASFFAATPANAAILLCYEVGSTQPQCGSTDSNVNVDHVTATPVAGVSTLGGHLNDDPTQLLTFTSSGVNGETLVGSGSGQAVVSPLDELLNGSVTFQLIGQTFNLATFNLNPLDGNSPFTDAQTVQVSYTPVGATSPITYTLGATGQNFYGIYGSLGERIESITWSGYQPAGSGIADIRQVRVNVGQDVTTGIPEPSTWAMLLFGFAAIGGAMRRKRTPNQRLKLQLS